MQTIVERYEMFWQCSLLHSTPRTYYVYVLEFMRYCKLKINLKAKSLAEDLYLVTREVKLISNKENLIKWEFTIYTLRLLFCRSQCRRSFDGMGKNKEKEKIQSKSK
jgi:hypothetical protein